jgi:hypothetical protein
MAEESIETDTPILDEPKDVKPKELEVVMPDKFKVNCVFFSKGNCKYGEKCRYSHKKDKGPEECKYFNTSKGCKNGRNCHFTHIEIESGKKPEKVNAPKANALEADAPKADALEADALEADAPKAYVPKAYVPKADAPKAYVPKADALEADAPKAYVPKYKTIICRNQVDGNCRFGKDCHYIHESKSEPGPEPNEKPSNYKTKLCNSWEKDGSCSYGAKCNFAHGKEDLHPTK